MTLARTSSRSFKQSMTHSCSVRQAAGTPSVRNMAVVRSCAKSGSSSSIHLASTCTRLGSARYTAAASSSVGSLLL